MLTNAIFIRPSHPSLTCLLKGSDTYISGLQDVQRQHQNERLCDPDTCITPSDPVEQTQTQLIFPCLAPRILPPIVHVVHTDSLASWASHRPSHVAIITAPGMCYVHGEHSS